MSRPDLESLQPLIQLAPEFFPGGGKKEWSYTSPPLALLYIVDLSFQ